MKRFHRVISAFLILTFLILPAGQSARSEGVFCIPSGITEIGSEAFSGMSFSDGIFIPGTCTDIASDAFSDPASLHIYGFTGSAAEAYASNAGAEFTSVDLKNLTLTAPSWVSPDRAVEIPVQCDCAQDVMFTFQVYKDEALVFTGEKTAASAFTHTFREGGQYLIRVTAESSYSSLSVDSAIITVPERIQTNEDVFYIAVGETVSVISESETRTVSLKAPDSGLSVSGHEVTGTALGAYTVTASAETSEGTVYTDIPVEVIVPAESVSIKAGANYVLENHTLSLTAAVSPENATYQHVHWSVDNEELASVDENGILTAHKAGTVTVYAVSGDVQAEFTLRIEKPVSGLTVTALDMPEVLYSGMSFILTSSATPSDAYDSSVTWTSLTPEIAAVHAFTGEVTTLSEGEACIKATANDLGGAKQEYTFTVYAGPAGIRIVSAPGILREGDEFQLECEVLPENAGDKTLKFESSDPAVIEVSASGLITAVAPGSAYVTLEAVNGYKASVPVTVAAPVSSVETVLDTVYLNPGMTCSPIGNFVFIKPENATYQSLTWSSDNGYVATVDKDTGLITAENDGTCTVKGVSHNGKTVSFTVKVVSDAKVIKKLAVSSTYGALNVGNTAVLTPKADVSNKYSSGTWYSDHPEVLDIVFIDSSNKATIKALAPGYATVYAVSSSGLSAHCTVIVNPLVVTGMYLNASSLSLNAGDVFPLGATIYPENATATDLVWTSSNEKVAAVDENGLVHACSGGTAVITAASEDGVSASCKVTVNTIRMTDAQMDESEITVLAGGIGYPSYTVVPENATPASFYWRSSDTSVVTVNSMSGKMRFIKAGSAVVSGTALDGSGLNIAMTVNVTELPVTSFTSDTESVSLLPGETHPVHTRVLPAGASYAAPSFSSADETIASVSGDGVITAVSKGSTVITVSVGYGDYVHTLEIDVTVEAVNDVTYRALIMGQFTVPATDGYLPFANNSTKGFNDALSLSSVDGNRYQITRVLGSPSPGAIRSSIQRLAGQADENDVTVIFFLTHGTNTGSEGYQMQTNSGVVIESLDMLNALKQISGHVVFVLCTCHSGRILSTQGAAALKNAGGSYEGLNGPGQLSILCSSLTTNSSYYRINDEKLSYDFYTYAVTRGLGWDMLGDSSIGTPLADSNGDGKVTVSELASYSRGATQRAISAFIQQNGKADFSGHAAQFPSWQIADGDEDLVIFER